MLRVAVLISGRGSNLKALLEAYQDTFRIQLVVSNHPKAKGLLYAYEHGIPTALVDHHDYSNRKTFEDTLLYHLKVYKIQFICLAGFMRILSGDFVDRWKHQILNIHPSLLPAFRGLHTHQRVLESGTPWSGCTVHFVRQEVDQGPILLQAIVPVYATDDPESLAMRVLQQEHLIYPLALKIITNQDLVLKLVTDKERLLKLKESKAVDLKIGGIPVTLTRATPQPSKTSAQIFLLFDTIVNVLKMKQDTCPYS